MVVSRIPYVGSAQYAKYREALKEPKPPTKAQTARAEAAARREARCRERGMPVGILLQKKSGRYLARVGKLNVPGSYATISEAVAAREAMIVELQKVGYDVSRTTRT